MPTENVKPFDDEILRDPSIMKVLRAQTEKGSTLAEIIKKGTAELAAEEERENKKP